MGMKEAKLGRYYKAGAFGLGCLIVSFFIPLPKGTPVVQEEPKTVQAIEPQEASAAIVKTVEEKPEQKPAPKEEPKPQGHLTRSGGVFYGESGKETWYNLPMEGVVGIMRSLGYTEEEWPYWEREDGCKMLGEYIICGANLEIRPRGSLVETSLGTAIVCDTGGFAEHNKTQIDIAVTW